MKINRIVFDKLRSQILRPEISILLGARQVGKTVLMEDLRNTCEEQRERVLYLNLELPTHLQQVSGTEAAVYARLADGPKWIFIDEFHYLKNASKIFKAIFDSKQKVKIFASGSSSIEIHKHLKESLAGRLIKNRIYPLTLSETLQSKHNNLETYFKFGGLPGLVHERTEAEKIRLLESIVESYLVKDIKSLIKEENIRAFNHLLYLLAQSQGSIVSVSSLANEVGLSEPTIKKNLDILAQTYVCYELHSFARNLGNELKKSKKYYLYDLGIRNLLLKNFKPLHQRKDVGCMGETWVAHNLIRQLMGNMEVRFWRTKAGDEVDFVLLKNQVPYPIEVKTTLGKPCVTDGLKKFIDGYPETQLGFIFCRDIHDTLEYKHTQIHILPWEASEKISVMQQPV